MTLFSKSNVLNAVLREIPENLSLVLWTNVLSGLSTTGVLLLVQEATNSVKEDGQPSGRLLLIFLLTLALSTICSNTALTTASHDSERLVHRLRLRLFELVRRSDLVTVQHIGRTALNDVMINDTNALGTTLPVLAFGLQTVMWLAFLALYLAWMSPLACAAAFGLGWMALSVRYARTRELRQQLTEAQSAEADVFDGLNDMLRGFKEVKLSRPRSAELLEAIANALGRTRRTNITAKRQWGRDHAIVQVMFYGLVGLMVFVVPLFTENFHTVVVPATLAALFIIGPISSISFITPMIAEADKALSNIEEMERRLGETIKTETQDDNEIGNDSRRPPLPQPSRIALAAGRFTYRDETGKSAFNVGPLDVEFHAGEIAFILGGNGSGKSTMLRLLTGLIPLDSGALLADSHPIDADQMQDFRDHISAIFSDNHLSRRLQWLGPVSDTDVARLLTRLEMRDKVSITDGCFSTTRLSTGQRKRLAMLVAILEDKRIVILDEWAADQDAHFRRRFYEELLPELRDLGKIVICVTHDERWFHLASRTYRMDEGRLQPMAPAGGAGGPA